MELFERLGDERGDCGRQRLLDPTADLFPPEVELVMSALEAGGYSGIERRSVRRVTYRACAQLRLFSDTQNGRPWTLYTRDVNRRGLAFLTSHRLPLGHGGVLDVVGPDGRWLSINCTLLRCREASPGWFEGSVYFNRDQPAFAELE
jgi:hypothetical protein